MPSQNFLFDFLGLLFPRTCSACSEVLIKGESLICNFCFLHFPFTRFSDEKENRVTEIFWGRVPIESATALLFYEKGGKVQQLIHNFKYRGAKEVGWFLGSLLGSELKSSTIYKDMDVIVPVPLHPFKFKQRGFNQSAEFGKGLSECLGIPQNTTGLLRVTPTGTQTRKTRFKRWENVESVFHVPDPLVFANKNILLVDDVVTTGATMESCARLLLQSPNARVWLAAIALAT
ncbi:MAG TPA: hypothetical protein VLH37_10485 [Bacteroidales bacterium]|nr:hypothetical protein [Bacteroidales bacterium]